MPVLGKMGVSVVDLVIMFTGVLVATYIITLNQTNCQLDNIDLSGKVVIVTGANAGIGYHIALEVAKR